MRLLTIFCLRLTALGFILSRLHEASGIKCWVCDGKRSLEECHEQYGQMLECTQSDHVCQNDYRTVRGQPLIIKGCKQAQACETEVKQNAANNQCGRLNLKKNLVCRCCCSTSGCNAKESGCLPPPPPCKHIRRLQNGRVHCHSREIKFGSQCSFTCQNGYELVGIKRVVCKKLSKGSKKGSWSPQPLPFCKKVIVKCNPARSAPKNGYLDCENSKEYKTFKGFNYAGSSCRYSCYKNYYVEGKRVTHCEMNKEWNNPPATCVRGECTPDKEDVNRVTLCTEGYAFGSSCNFTCKEGFTLVGEAKSSCRQIGEGREGLWTRRFPRCAKVVCQPEHTELINGAVTCTDQNFKDSVCRFSCNVGYDMDKSPRNIKSIRCKDSEMGDGKGKWSGQPPSCSPVICDKPHNNPQNGRVLCTNENNFGSVCTFTCDEGFDLVGTTEYALNSSCIDDGDGDSLGKWTTEAPNCEPITCDPMPSHPKNGRVHCTNNNFLESECSYECLDDFDLVGTKKLVTQKTCKATKGGTAKGHWNGPEIECAPIKCAVLPPLENGLRLCTLVNTAYSGSFCVMYCDGGYYMTGISYISCRNLKRDGDDLGDWSAPPPVCELGKCQPPKYDEITVVGKCRAPSGFAVEEYRVGTVCRYECINDGYYMVPNKGNVPILDGFLENTCASNREWSNLSPRCIRKTCLPVVTSIPNGYSPKCTDGNNFDSRCEFSCMAKHGLTHERPLVCQADGDNDEYGEWSAAIPRCERNECDEYGIINNGHLNCSDGVKVGSICDLICINRYTQKRYEKIVCKPNAKWDQEKYVCCVKCLFNRRLNILSLIDSTAFQTKSEWRSTVSFLDKSIRFLKNHNLDIQIGSMRFAEDIESRSALEKTRLRTENDIESAIEVIANMPITGVDANIGKALAFANDVYFARKDRWREEFVILVTSGNSADKFIDKARVLRERGFHILVVGYKINRSALKTFQDVTGDDNKLLSVSSKEGLDMISDSISMILMTSGCPSVSKSQPCS